MLDLIVSDPNICHGQATIEGTRIAVTIILDSSAAGETAEGILALHPTLTPDAIRGAAAYAALLAREEVQYHSR